ncbi:hypothetical protein ACMFMG_000217 [Clarireedia jacksonii]
MHISTLSLPLLALLQAALCAPDLPAQATNADGNNYIPDNGNGNDYAGDGTSSAVCPSSTLSSFPSDFPSGSAFPSDAYSNNDPSNNDNSNAPYPAYIYSPLEQIRYTLAQETFLLDSKDWNGLNAVYTVDAVANFTALGAGVWDGIAEIIANEQKALGDVAHGSHQITSSAILINPSNFSEATVTSYYQFNHFDTVQNGSAQHIWSAWSKYNDKWVDTGDFSAGGPSSWRVKERQVVLVGGAVVADWEFASG